MKRNISLQWEVLYSPEKVWEVLTNFELVKKWIPKISDFKAIEGFEYEQHQKARGDWDGIIYHKVLKIVPSKTLSYTFQSGPQKGIITMNTIVTFNLTPIENGTLVKLEHSGFEGLKNCFTSFILELGWKNQISKRINEILAEAD
jgi:uncharacterized protein YndB with AHSA1/START domain